MSMDLVESQKPGYHLSIYHRMYIQRLLVTSRQACGCSGRRADSSILNPSLTRGLFPAAAGAADRKARACHGHGGEPLPGHEAAPARYVTWCKPCGCCGIKKQLLLSRVSQQWGRSLMCALDPYWPPGPGLSCSCPMLLGVALLKKMRTAWSHTLCLWRIKVAVRKCQLAPGLAVASLAS